MSREFPFLNEEAEGLWCGNKVFEAQFSATILNQDRILINNHKEYLALSGSVERHPSQEELWDLSSICSLGQNGRTHSQ